MQHNEDIDFLKGIGIALVVLGHCFTTALAGRYYVVGVLKDIIYTFHMPLFFIVSGYIQGLRPYSADRCKLYIGRQIRRLFIPYTAWSLVLYIFYYLLKVIDVYKIQENISLKPVRLMQGILAYDVRTGNVLWFAYILCIISVVSYLLHNVIRNRKINALFLLLVLSLGFMANMFIKDEMFVLKRFLVMWIYYETGVFTGIYIKDISFKANALLSIILSVLYVIAYVLYTRSEGVINYSLKVICALLAVFILYSLSSRNNSWIYSAFSYIGKRTVFIYYLHNPYIVLVTVTFLTEAAGVNAIASIAAAFILGMLIPLTAGSLILSKNRFTKTIFLGG
ncbi:fucose 4-O-acetylase-like acetyltransferase [Ruminiclostridium sufflavum DSM 19573]|uniref:Fucose 4-O-acetylase-like acetyltransferase n=1 Tax=Ruminiclostridium sufflavum DSM 19573 TaxID=1121337 RepID=A0A318XQM2_9FIRM|nr:acyltransferase [Ruminiclostridium sufflavum]PYG89495.1 fucose 4-O-acetylase-like acetyltransferase [Ruminiclostridium sufflavum DSM 19573]